MTKFSSRSDSCHIIQSSWSP